MNVISASDIKERACEIMNNNMQTQLEELCTQLNSEYEEHIFYVKGNYVYLDCSDYSPRDVKIFGF